MYSLVEGDLQKLVWNVATTLWRRKTKVTFVEYYCLTLSVRTFDNINKNILDTYLSDLYHMFNSYIVWNEGRI